MKNKLGVKISFFVLAISIALLTSCVSNNDYCYDGEKPYTLRVYKDNLTFNSIACDSFDMFNDKSAIIWNEGTSCDIFAPSYIIASSNGCAIKKSE